MNEWEGLPFLEATLTLFHDQREARQRGVAQGYRAHWLRTRSDGTETGNDGPIRLVDLPEEAWLEPGVVGRIRIFPLVPECWADVGVGARLDLWEGRVIGTAVVTVVHLNSSATDNS